MTDTTFYVALDADNEPCVWRQADNGPALILCQSDLNDQHADAWDVLTGHLEVFQ